MLLLESTTYRTSAPRTGRRMVIEWYIMRVWCVPNTLPTQWQLPVGLLSSVSGLRAWWPCHAQEMLRGLRIIMSRRDDALHRLHRGGRWGRQRRKESGGGTCGGPNSIGSDGRRGTGGGGEDGGGEGVHSKGGRAGEGGRRRKHRQGHHAMKVEVRVDGNAERHTRHGLRDRHRWCRWGRLVALPHRLPRLPLERLNPFTQLNLDGGLNITAYTCNLGSAERGKRGQRGARGRGRRRTGSTSGNSRQTGLMRWPRGLARASFTSLSLNSSLCEMRRRRCLGGGCGCTCGRCASPASSALAATVPRMPSAVVPAARPEVDARCGMRSISLAGYRWRSFRYFSHSTIIRDHIWAMGGGQ